MYLLSYNLVKITSIIHHRSKQVEIFNRSLFKRANTALSSVRVFWKKGDETPYRRVVKWEMEREVLQQVAAHHSGVAKFSRGEGKAEGRRKLGIAYVHAYALKRA